MRYWSIYSVPDSLPRPVHSPLLIETDDSLILETLCYVMVLYLEKVDFPEIREIISTKLSEDVTILDRLLQLLDYPSWKVNCSVVDTLRAVTVMDDRQEFSFIGQRMSHAGRYLLALWYWESLSRFFYSLAYQYQSSLISPLNLDWLRMCCSS
eukprot:Protomagalhaensia_wolfi_Nauph_80__685@NODE_1391_length_1548_cov_68_756793_g1076_i0_p1_GENE_NODE_1391_length_1548_cov_68_756793_g1076_i0NODE_1391_length_1548_cov_68_756793_g1076_i0_p1_ORF_typecomplete_len153_score9_07_NODE_1391_length_1548_cov_68_756793_g1076_i06711129